jgi:hypothetical protein
MGDIRQILARARILCGSKRDQGSNKNDGIYLVPPPPPPAFISSTIMYILYSKIKTTASNDLQ